MVHCVRTRLLCDTCAIVSDLLDKLEILPHPFITPSVFKELEDHSNMTIRDRGDSENLRTLKERATKAHKFYSRKPLIVREYHDFSLDGFADLTGKQIAYDVAGGMRLRETEVAGDKLTNFGRVIASTLVKRINAKGILIDEYMVDSIQRIAMEGQKYAFNSVRNHNGRIAKPDFATDLGILGTARLAPIYSGTEVVIVSNDSDLKQINYFSERVQDRKIRIVPSIAFKGYTGQTTSIHN